MSTITTSESLVILLRRGVTYLNDATVIAAADEIERLRAERDEARLKVERLRDKARLKVERLRAERDEARRTVERLRDTARRKIERLRVERDKARETVCRHWECQADTD
jgi:F0F1-type ATP synthase membrane subunit b/b'